MDPVLIDSSSGCIVQSWADLSQGFLSLLCGCRVPGLLVILPCFLRSLQETGLKVEQLELEPVPISDPSAWGG